MKSSLSRRSLLHPLLLSTLPHFLTLLAGGGCSAKATFLSHLYPVVVTISSSLSLLWHASFEAVGWVGFMDYAFAALWVATEVALAGTRGDPHTVVGVLLVNAIATLANVAVDQLARSGIVQYETGHSVWHLLSATGHVWMARAICHG